MMSVFGRGLKRDVKSSSFGSSKTYLLIPTLVLGFKMNSSNIKAAARAFRVGSKPDFVLGGTLHPSVKWAEEDNEVDPDELAKVDKVVVQQGYIFSWICSLCLTICRVPKSLKLLDGTHEMDSFCLSHTETKKVPWSDERPLENKELNAIIGALFTLWRY
ncbi:Nucleotide-binding, alpha-beta plait [Artemisia annua]|uniref:Nucleotide-binding, alpha-beta plait n=1 Tax=Artemisia annua TaxID=35608 RepID=A0A2U1KWM9_ARTAN|nr:Nucleotide-binding, alpha-beta plait [Artemisia annua]